MSTSETICALASSSGNASVAIIRISGPKSLSIAQLITKTSLKPRYAHFTSFYDENDQAIDQGISIYFKAPHSFTGEDVVELQPHGNPYVCQQILQQATQQGARLAIAGEFSERAFLNGKLDLTQLEAIADLISSGSQQAARSAVQSMQGKFSEQVNILLQQLIQIRTHIEASLDFADEDIETETRRAVTKKVVQLKQQINELSKLAKHGAQLQKGYTVVLTGSPNVGKSSLFNALCGEDRAIVTDIPGTTRDVVSADLNINGVPIRLLDTAGIRDHAELIEREGIARAQFALEGADVVIKMFDASRLNSNNEFTNDSDNLLTVVNKCDLVDGHINFSKSVVKISVKTGEGLDILRKELQRVLHIQPSERQAPFSARTRHLEALQRCLKQVELAEQQLNESSPLELAAEECRLAQQILSEITGEFTPDDLLDYVFREFCIGK